jgi:pyruvate dehydrogenase E2 component (dihydrolipoamide acetyltransferase)
MTDFLMPTLGADMTSGKLVAWRKKPGDAVHRGDIVAEVETDKGVIEIEIFIDGVIDKLLVEPGTRVPVGSPLASIRTDGESVPTPAKPVVESARVRISPAARELARARNIDISTIHGTGPDGAITREDIERTSNNAPPSVEPVSAHVRMRQAIASTMSRSKREIPHYYLSHTLDMTPALNWLSIRNESRSVTERLLPGVLFLKAVALALREYPDLNGVWTGDQVRRNPAIHVGVAISLRQGGLVAPAIRETDTLPLEDVMTKLQDLVARARAGSLRSSEISDPTITVTSLGDQGVEATYGVIYPPQVAIVGFGKIVERPWVVENQIVARNVVTVTLAADHRVSDGHQGARFLSAFERLLQQPDTL